MSGVKGAFPHADFQIEVFNEYPGLETSEDAEVVRIMRNIVGSSLPTKVEFGTEGGLFARDLRMPTVVCGPGSMKQGHRPDEYIQREQLTACSDMLDRLAEQVLS
ncbi:MAG: acetylornithine deacetylase [Microvirga sp.]|jgi:acetylornithine deacetylase|nr:acetylornithine deacetylase [Microvirga sp.]